jgi:hypothetical protein
MSTAVTVARAARALIEDPDRWTTGNYAQTAGGRECTPDDLRAVRWCAVGALRACAADDDDVRGAIGRALCCAANDLGYRRAATLNDAQGHAAVLAMYDRAIRLLEQEAPDDESSREVRTDPGNA